MRLMTKSGWQMISAFENPKDGEPFVPQVGLSFSVVTLSIQVRATIRFYDQTNRRAVEVRDVVTDRILSSKLRPCDRTPSQ
jgi:hypothetical protein